MAALVTASLLCQSLLSNCLLILHIERQPARKLFLEEIQKKRKRRGPPHDKRYDESMIPGDQNKAFGGFWKVVWDQYLIYLYGGVSTKRDRGLASELVVWFGFCNGAHYRLHFLREKDMDWPEWTETRAAFGWTGSHLLPVSTFLSSMRWPK